MSFIGEEWLSSNYLHDQINTHGMNHILWWINIYLKYNSHITYVLHKQVQQCNCLNLIYLAEWDTTGYSNKLLKLTTYDK